jgi:hypothetical protein
MDRDEIMEQLNASDWTTVVNAFDGMDASEIESELDTMFPREDNGDVALAIRSTLRDTRICILATEDQGHYEVHPNATPEAWIDVVSDPEVSEAVPVEELHGWGRWKWAYRVQYGPEMLTYFIDGTPDLTESP